MKICLVYEFLTECGGIERLIANHADMLKKIGAEVEIVTCVYTEEALEKTGLKGIKITNLAPIPTKIESLDLISSFVGLNKLKDIDADLFISYSFPSNFLIRNKKAKKINFINHFPRWLYSDKKERLLWASSTYGIKRMLIFILSLFFENRLKALDKELVKKNDLIFTSTVYLKNKIDPVYRIDSIINYPPIDPVFKESKNKIKEKFILCSGRIIPDKKFDWLIESCSYMKNKLPLYLTGQGNESYMKKLSLLAKKKGVELKFLGKLSTEELVKYYSSAQVFAFPVPNCEYGLVTIECLACGTPAVVWGDGSGPAEQVIDGVNGFYAKPYNLKDFGMKMDKCIDMKMKEKNKKKIVESMRKFSYDEVEKGFLKEIRKVIGLDYNETHKSFPI